MTTHARRLIPFLFRALLAAAALALPLIAEAAPPTAHRHVEVDGVRIFYREAGPKDAPHVLLLHGFPASSHMFRDLIPALADRFHVVAPDYPGFGHSDMPAPDAFAYTFDHLADVIDAFTARVGLDRYALYVQDYGAPIGFRLAVRHPERIRALVVQNGNAYEEGLREFWDPIKAYWKDPGEANRQALAKGLEPESTKWQYLHGTRRPERVSPDAWLVDQALLDRPGNKEIQLQLFYSYRSNPPLYPAWQAYFRAAPAADADRVGQERSDLPGRGRPPVHARPEGRRAPPARHRPLRPRGGRRHDRAADARLPRASSARPELTHSGASSFAICPRRRICASRRRCVGFGPGEPSMPASTLLTRRTLLRSTGALAGAALVHRYAARSRGPRRRPPRRRRRPAPTPSTCGAPRWPRRRSCGRG